ncbi:MAG: adenylate/guanylate cyclase domain-containing protein [Alphaproteobacteria bacterium]|nr:adenylate/guanylate cyclase domain-containing protein [Alphaproteobacteria bacterium]
MLDKVKPNGWTIFHFVFLLSLLFAAILFSGSPSEMRLRLREGVFDQFNQAHPREASGTVVIIDIDEKSLEKIGQWPWPRNTMAKLTERLAKMGARSIVLDGVFGEEDRSAPLYFLQHLPEQARTPELEQIFKNIQTTIWQSNKELLDYDAMFAKSIKDSEVFVTGFSYGRTDRTQNRPINKNRLLAKKDVQDAFLKDASKFSAAAVTLPIFSKNAAGEGSIMAQPDQDGVLRRAGMIFTDGKTLYPSLSLEALRVGLLGKKGTVILGGVPEENKREIDTAYRLVVGENIIPVDSDGILHVYYRQFCNEQDMTAQGSKCTSLDYLPAYKIIDPQYEAEMSPRVKGKVVLIGASAEGLKDLRNTALQPFRPGVEIHANVIEQVLQEKYLLRPSITEAAEASYILIAGLLFILLSPFIGVAISTLLCATIIAFAGFGAYYAYVQYGLLIDPVYPSIAVFTIFVVSTILSYARAESRRKYIRSALGLYVSPEVMKELEKSPEKLSLGGETRELTVMFTDIRRFTAISEGMEPDELVGMMNEFLTAMTDVVLSEQGTVDKYIGDAMMAFWNAPHDIDGHERLACYAALQMQAALRPVNERIAVRANEVGRKPVLLSAGIGINTGLCAVGNMGSRQRFAYSALGDAVNLAARLEGQTKFYGVDILVNETTHDKAPGLAMLELDLIQVIGKVRPVRIYALVGDEGYAQDYQFKSWNALHTQMLTRYRARDFDHALKMVAECREASDGTLESYYDMYEKRIKDMKKKKKIPADWQGIYIAESK